MSAIITLTLGVSSSCACDCFTLPLPVPRFLSCDGSVYSIDWGKYFYRPQLRPGQVQVAQLVLIKFLDPWLAIVVERRRIDGTTTGRKRMPRTQTNRCVESIADPGSGYLALHYNHSACLSILSHFCAFSSLFQFRPSLLYSIELLVVSAFEQGARTSNHTFDRSVRRSMSAIHRSGGSR
uniref:Putative secreted protein n=1 Tax=Anopheles triannulatus TaxID=58253 RepID=A0A2M4B607_9DIPT